MNTEDLLDFSTPFNFTTELEKDMVTESEIFLLAIIGLVGLLSNVLVIVVLLAFFKMRTTTMTYIVNLAIVDVCFLIGIPFIIVTMIKSSWVFGEVLCKAHMLVSNVALSAGAIFLILLSANCYIDVCHPKLHKNIRKPFMLSCILMTSWILSIILTVPIIIHVKHIEDMFIGGTGQNRDAKMCITVWSENNWETQEQKQAIVVLCHCIFYFLIPLCLTFIFTALVIHKQRSLRKTTILITAVGTVYFWSWLPYWTVNLWLMFGNNENLFEFVDIIYLFSSCWSFCKCVINPIIYLVFSYSFRKSHLKT